VASRMCSVSNVSSELLVVLLSLRGEDSFVCGTLKFGDDELLDRALSRPGFRAYPSTSNVVNSYRAGKWVTRAPFSVVGVYERGTTPFAVLGR